MADLQDVAAAVIAALAKAQAASDAQSVMIAETYREHQFLRHFSIPRMVLADVELRVPFAINSIDGRVIDLAAPWIDDLAAHVAIRMDLLAQHPGLSGLSDDVRDKLSQAEAAVRSAIVAALAPGRQPVTAIIEAVIRAVAHAAESIWQHDLARRHREEAQRAVRAVAADVLPAVVREQLAAGSVGAEAARPPSLDVLVTADELSSVPREQLSHLTLRILRQDQEWVSVASPDGASASLRLS